MVKLAAIWGVEWAVHWLILSLKDVSIDGWGLRGGGGARFGGGVLRLSVAG